MQYLFNPTGQFLIQNVVPQASGESAKVKVKVRVNIHGVFSVSSASLVEIVKTADGEEPMETDQTGKEEEVRILHWVKENNDMGVCGVVCCLLYVSPQISRSHRMSVWPHLGFC